MIRLGISGSSLTASSIAISGAEDESVTAELFRQIVVHAGGTVAEGSAELADVVILHPDNDLASFAREPDAIVLLDTDALSASSFPANVVRGFGLGNVADFRADELDATFEGTTFTLIHEGASRVVRLRVLGERVVLSVLAALAAAREVGVELDEAIVAVEAANFVGRHRMEVVLSPEGVTVINDAASASPDSMASSLKTLAQITRGGPRSVAVLGEVTAPEDEAREIHDRIGRLVVRLNIQKLFVVSHSARHIHNAAGLEGSWDGESVLTNSAEEAYDLLREELREGDVVLVKSSGADSLATLGDRIGGRIA